MTLSSRAGVRFIVIVDRGYPETIPLSVTASTVGTDIDKTVFINTRGVEPAMLVDKLIQQLSLFPMSEDRTDGGVALLGWSGGTIWTLSCIANMDQVSLKSQSLMAAYVRAHIIKEPPCGCLGLPLPPELWSPLTDATIPDNQRILFYLPWITAYFDHGDLQSRDLDAISYSYYAPSVHHAPTIYNISAKEIDELFFNKPLDYEHALILATLAKANAVYRKACDDQVFLEMLPKMIMSVLVGDATCSFSLNALFSIQNDNEEENGRIHFNIVPGLNHFIQWDEPKKTFDAYVNAL
ncbi:hypothetical protein ACEPAG_5808 [Sanghuangporus baumii]